jgi:exo-1,4-beta-D-glucosaminidase
MVLFSRLLVLMLVGSLSGLSSRAAESVALPNWQLQTSAKVKDSGAVLSTAKYRPRGWHQITVPAPVVGALVKNKVYPDPFFGKNLRSIPGTTYPVGENFSNLPMPADSPFAVPWWYRTEFQVPAAGAVKTITLHFDGINYRANIWLNGQQLAKSDEVVGAWRLYEFDVTDRVVPGKPNVLAVQVFPAKENELAITFVDWNPQPPDKNMGLWRPVYLTTTGPVTVRHPFVETKIDLPEAKTARLTVSAELENHSKQPVRGTLQGAIGDITFSQPVELAAGELKEVLLKPEQFQQLTITNPRLWWPAQMGKPELYDLALKFEADGKVSDGAKIQFGIREITSENLDHPGRTIPPSDEDPEIKYTKRQLFKVNGKPILIRGGGWAADMFLRADPKRYEQEITYAQDMGLNTIRLEGKMETDEFFQIADRLGMLVMAGWCCCDHWEHWDKWKPEDHTVAEHSQRDQIKRLRSHPSLLVWLNGSDFPPPAPVEKMYIGVLKSCRWPNPYLSSATGKVAQFSGVSGVKMTGPYEYIPPRYWFEDKDRGGAWGFNTETSMGPAPPPIESLRRMIPKEHLWPMGEYWDYHAGGGQFKNLKTFATALNNRYGETRSAEEFAAKSQMMAYEGIRAMFEAYGRNKYQSTGVIQWMLNNGWPSTIWHLYDFYLRPGGGYFGAKKALEPLHPQFSYDDRSVWVVSSQYQDAPGLKLTATVYDLNMAEKHKQEATLDAKADSTNRAFTIAEPEGITPTYFLLLTLDDASGKRVASNLYWLSTKPETLEWEKSTWYFTPARSEADFTALNSLPKVRLQLSSQSERQGDKVRTLVTVKNPSKSIAFAVRLKANNGSEEILPVLWEDNYFALLPGEERQIAAHHSASDVGSAKVSVTAEGWNVEAQ